MSEQPATGDWTKRAQGGNASESGSEPRPSKAPGVPPLPTIPGYEILNELGRGGMGVVYQARQASSDRLVALKLIRDRALASAEDLARFRIEAEAAARMGHPNIVQLYEVGEHDGRPYLAMELVEGGSLDRHLAGQPQPAPQAAELVRTVALAVQHAHAKKVIHRDLKPANVLLQIADFRLQIEPQEKSTPAKSAICNLQSAIPKITDFGLAKRLDSESTAWTQDGAVLGSAGYMAPEQAAGRVRELGPAVDVYALGAILYELLTGRPPFQSDTWNQMLQQVLHDEPAPPTRLQLDVPRDLETVCLKCLEKEPGRRYATAGELADDLGRFLAGKPVAAVPLSATERLARLAGRDGFEIIGEIGRGPRSTVYQAVYGPLKQATALKVFQAGTCAREEWEVRLRRAADLWAGLSHPQVLPVQRAGWWDGTPYVAVEYVPQGSLAASNVSPTPNSPSIPPFRRGWASAGLGAALRLIEQLAEIVSYLHRQGVVHGNLKPSNVLLAADGIPRVVDLHSTGGLFLGALAANNQESAGLIYLAPEQVGDPSAELRPYTDVYGLGMILYEMLTGRPAFAGTTARDVLEQVRSQDPIPPSKLNPEVTPHLEAFCLRCLRKNPWQRYHRMFSLLKRLRYLREDLDSPRSPSARG